MKKVIRLITYLEKNNIATREILKISGVTLFFYLLSWVFFKLHLSWWAFSLLFVVLGGTTNLYVIDFNNFCMPVLAQSQKEFRKLKRKNPLRRICMLSCQTRLGWLADRFCIGKSIYSIGDFMIIFGAILIYLPFVVVTISLIV